MHWVYEDIFTDEFHHLCLSNVFLLSMKNDCAFCDVRCSLCDQLDACILESIEETSSWRDIDDGLDGHTEWT